MVWLIAHEDYQRPSWRFQKISRSNPKRATYGSNIYLDITLEMNPDFISLWESRNCGPGRIHAGRRFGVFDTDVHIEPAPIPEDEILDNVQKTAHAWWWLTKEINRRTLLRLSYIRQDGESRWIKSFITEKNLKLLLRYSNHSYWSENQAHLLWARWHRPA